VRDWLHFLPLPLASFDPYAPRFGSIAAALRGIGIAAALLAFGYLLNSLADRELDRDARKNPLIVAGAAHPRHALMTFVAVSLILAASGSWPVRAATIVALVGYVVYSTGPRLKSIPVVGSLVNISLFTPLLFVGMYGTVLPPGFAALAVACAALVLETQLIHEAADRFDDAAGGVRTTWLTVGALGTAAMATVAGLTAAGAALAITRSVAIAAVVAAVFALAFPSLLAWQGGNAHQAARLRIAHRWCGVLLGGGLFAAWRCGLS
jgi:4-hydroxybenzoate polyprenyltransferase